MYLIAAHPGHLAIFHGNPQLEVPTIYKAYFLGLKFREYPHKISHKIWPYMVQYLHFRILKFPLIGDGKKLWEFYAGWRPQSSSRSVGL